MLWKLWRARLPSVRPTTRTPRSASASATGTLFSPPRRFTSRIAASAPSISGSADATLSAVSAAAKLGEVHLLVAGQGVDAVAQQAARIAGVGKVHVADDAAFARGLNNTTTAAALARALEAIARCEIHTRASCDGMLALLEAQTLRREIPAGVPAGVRVGNVLTFACNGRIRVIRVEALPHRRGPAPEAQGCYTDLAQPSGPANVSQESAAD